MPDIKPFQPKPGGSIVVPNAVTASAAALLDDTADQVALTNTSATAIAYWRCDNLSQSSDPVTAVTTATGFPILPGTQIRLTVGFGWKKFTVIASAADGNLIVSPGKGN